MKTFNFEGTQLVEKKAIFFCVGCYFKHKGCGEIDPPVVCVGEDREDKNDIIFVETREDDLNTVKNYFKIKRNKGNKLIDRFKKLLGVNR